MSTDHSSQAHSKANTEKLPENAPKCTAGPDKPIYLVEKEPALFEGKTHLETLHEMRALKGSDVPTVFQGRDGQDVYVTTSTAMVDCSKSYIWSDGTVQLVRKGGSMRFDYIDGNGFEGIPTAGGGWSERHWGSGPFFPQIRAYIDLNTTEVTSLDRKEGYLKVETPQGLHVHHWGPRAKDNYDSEWKGHYEHITNADGTKDVIPR